MSKQQQKPSSLLREHLALQHLNIGPPGSGSGSVFPMRIRIRIQQTKMNADLDLDPQHWSIVRAEYADRLDQPLPGQTLLPSVSTLDYSSC
jgi:hypothetical protein